MRVIDIEPILAWANDPEVHEPYGVRGSELMRKLWDAPTIDAVSVVHGKWIKRHGTINCSVCKRSNWSACFEDTVRSFNFCPNCGAKMDGYADRKEDN